MKAGKVLLFGGIATALVFAGLKGAEVYNRVSQALGTINFNFSFVRIDGFVGEKVTWFTNPTIRVLFNLNLKNFSGFNLDVQKIYCRVEVQKAGTKEWAVIALPSGYINLKLLDGAEMNKPLSFDFKGLSTITSLTNKDNRHRVVITAEVKGQRLPAYTTDLELAGSFSKFLTTAKKLIGLKGVAELAA